MTLDDFLRSIDEALDSASEPERANFRLAVAERHARVLDDEAKDALAHLRTRTADPSAIVAELRREAADVDVDRVHAFEKLRALAVVEAAVAEKPAAVVMAALAASADVAVRDPKARSQLIERWSWGRVQSETRELSAAAGIAQAPPRFVFPVLGKPAASVELRVEAPGTSVAIAIAPKYPARPVVEDDLDTFVRRVSATRHPVTFAAFVGARHVARVENKNAVAHEIAWRLWSAALAEPPAIPPALVKDVDRMFGKTAGGGGIDDLHSKVVLKTAITSSTKTLVLTALGASVELGNLGGGSDEEFAKRIDQRRRHSSQQEEKQWLSMIAGTLALLDEHSPEAVRALASAHGLSLERPMPPPPPPRSVHAPPSSPPLVYETTLGGVRLKLIETAHQRFRIELGGERRRVRVRKEVVSINYPKPASDEWIDDDDAELPSLVGCLKHATSRTETNGELKLERFDERASGGSERWTAKVSIADDGVVEVDMQHGTWDGVDPNVGW